MSGASPGRVCLLGEHCDWAGGSCLVAPLQRGVWAEVAPDAGWSVRSDFGFTRLPASLAAPPDDPNRTVAAALRALRRAGWAPPPMRLSLRADLPAGRGFSSSAAACVATIRAVAALLGREPGPDEVAELAYRAEREELGVGCGRMDPLACAHGRPLFIRWGPPMSVEPIAASPALLCAAFPTGRPAAEILAALAEKLPLAQPTIDAWGRLAERGADALRRGDTPALAAAMNEAQARYEALALPALEAPWLRAATRAAREAGALAAKFTGAGGDRSLVALLPCPEAAGGVARALQLTGAEII